MTNYPRSRGFKAAQPYRPDAPYRSGSLQYAVRSAEQVDSLGGKKGGATVGSPAEVVAGRCRSYEAVSIDGNHLLRAGGPARLMAGLPALLFPAVNSRL